MTKRIFRSIFLVALAVLLIAMTLVLGAVYAHSSENQAQQLRIGTELAAEALANEGASFLSGLQDFPHCRITWIDGSGTVLFDNRQEPGALTSHLQRQEVADALKTGYGESVRYSDTLMQRSVYTARRLPDGTVLRLSTTQASALRLVLAMWKYILLIFAAIGGLSFFLARRLSQSAVQPLNELNLDDPLSNTRYEEITPLLQRLASQQGQLRGQSMELKRRQKEFNTVTRAMNEGLVLLSSSGTILSINPAAAKLLDVTQNCLGADFSVANRNEAIASLVDRAVVGEKGELTLALGDGEYLAAASPVRSEGAVFGVALLLFDVTQKHRAELLRQEFTANVSHELKTPLHAISGYAELMKSGLVPPRDMAVFSEKIYAEAQRMTLLVEDTLRLSRLDEGASDMTWAETDLFAAAQKALNALKAPAELNQVTLHLEGEPISILSIPQLVDAIVSNLAENAVKYARPGGSMTIRLEDQPTFALLTVADNGIGIPREDMERIFERFYRVDKSHSRAVGGTGLGLSIVKHAAAILHAEVTLESELGVGTTVQVKFPKSTV